MRKRELFVRGSGIALFPQPGTLTNIFKPYAEEAMTYFLAVVFVGILCLILLLNLISLPANWFILALVLLWKLIGPTGSAISYAFLAGLLGLALLGEAMELGLQLWAGKRYGSSKRGNIGGIIGSILGAIFGAAFLLGFGAVIGALAGAFAGCLLMELWHGRTREEAFHAATGALIGRFFGMTVKLGIGVSIIYLAIGRIWPQSETMAAALW